MSNFRQREILELARKDGKVTVDGLAEAYNVTVQTIRRDLSELAESGKLERVHGGAVIPSGVVNIVYDERRRLNEEGKRAIAEHCAQAIPHGASVFMNIGTSTEAVAQEMLHHENLLVVTNNLNIANILAANQSCEIILTGGVLRRADGGMVGGLTAEMVKQFKFDFSVLGCSAIDADGDPRHGAVQYRRQDRYQGYVGRPRARRARQRDRTDGRHHHGTLVRRPLPRHARA